MRRIQEEMRKAMDDGFEQLGDAVAEHERRLANVEVWKDAASMRIDALERLEREATQRMERMEAMLKGVGPDLPPPPSDLWDRPADRAVLQINTADWVEEGVLCEKIVRICADANIAKTMLEVYCGTSSAPVAAAAPGQRLVKRAAVRIKGEPGVAARRAAQVLGSIRTPTGGWAPLEVERSGGGKTRLYLGEDRSQRDIARERATKRLASAVEQAKPGRRAYPSKKDGVVSVDWRPVARVVISADRDKDVCIEFNANVVQDMGIDKDEVRRHFELAAPVSRAAAASQAEAQWCS